MTRKPTLFLALHTHKHGATPYFFHSPLTEDQFPRPEAMARILGIDYEPELLETIEYFAADDSDSIPTFDAQWRRAKEPAVTRTTPADTLRAFYDATAPDGRWGEHPDFPCSDWRYEVDNRDTRLGYWEWVAHQIEMNKDAARLE